MIDYSEVILTFSHSRTVTQFLCAAKEKKRSFGLFVAEGAPKFVLDTIYLYHKKAIVLVPF